MSRSEHVIFVLFLAGVLLWQWRTGIALGAWWRPRIARQDHPRTYWSLLAAQGAILAYVIVVGTDSWHFR
jgi:hypothetical protein